MKLSTVDSSSIYAVGYDSDTRTMEVVFYRTGVHRFVGVPAKVFKEFQKSDSMGNFYALFLQGQYHEQELR